MKLYLVSLRVRVGLATSRLCQGVLIRFLTTCPLGFFFRWIHTQEEASKKVGGPPTGLRDHEKKRIERWKGDEEEEGEGETKDGNYGRDSSVRPGQFFFLFFFLFSILFFFSLSTKGNMERFNWLRRVQQEEERGRHAGVGQVEPPLACLLKQPQQGGGETKIKIERKEEEISSRRFLVGNVFPADRFH